MHWRTIHILKYFFIYGLLLTTSIHFSLGQDPLFQAFNQQKSGGERLELVIHKFDQIEKDELSKWTLIFEDYQSIENQMNNEEEELYYKSLSALIEIKKNKPFT